MFGPRQALLAGAELFARRACRKNGEVRLFLGTNGSMEKQAASKSPGNEIEPEVEGLESNSLHAICGTNAPKTL